MELPKLTTEVKRRVIEVEFFMIIQKLKEGYKQGSLYELMEVLCKLFNVKTTQITFVLNMQNKLTYRPTKEESVLASKYLGISVRKLCKMFGMSNSTYYDMMQALEEHGVDILVPRFQPLQSVEIVRFNKGFKELFGPVKELL